MSIVLELSDFTRVVDLMLDNLSVGFDLGSSLLAIRRTNYSK